MQYAVYLSSPPELAENPPAPAFFADAFGGTNVDCYAFCKPGDSYQGLTGTQAPNGVSPHRCNTTDALGAFGATPNGTAASNGEHCMYSWFFEIDTAGALHKSPTSDTLGICVDHTKYRYDSNNDGQITPADAVWPPCAAMPLTATAPAIGATDLACVTTTTGGVMFTGKAKTYHRPLMNLPEFPQLHSPR